MNEKTAPLIHIEFFWSTSCPYCPSVQDMLEDLIIDTELGPYVIIEMIDVDSPVGQARAIFYRIKGVPALAINGHLKFIGVPQPILISNEVRKLINKIEQPRPSEPVQPAESDSSPVPEKQDNEFSLYT